MFGHLVKYSFLELFRIKEIIFWTLLFPFALATFMYMAFGNIFESTEKFEAVPVAVIKTGENPAAEGVFHALSGEGGMLQMNEADSEGGALKLLEEEKIEGIFYQDADGVRLKVWENGMEETVLQLLLKQYNQYEAAIKDIYENHPEKLQESVRAMTSGAACIKEQDSGSGNQDNVINYFYAIFAMTCLFASFSSSMKVARIQANVSALGQRRCVAPTHKMKMILAEFLVCQVFQFVLVCVLFVYVRYVLKLEIGDNIPAILLLLFVSTGLGNMIGVFVGAIPWVKEEAKIGILVSVSLIFSALSDLMVSGIRDLIEHHMPFLNDINPAALLVDSFYALNVYDGYERFAGNLIFMLILTALLAVFSFCMIRRNRYASI